VPLRTTHLVEGQPEIVGVAQLALAVVLGQLLGREDELPIGVILDRIGFGIEGVHDQAALDLDGLPILLVVEQDPAAEAPHAGQSGLVEHGVGPEVGDPVGSRRFLLADRREALAQVELAAAGQEGQAEDDQKRFRPSPACRARQDGRGAGGEGGGR
jgi:hypothetical protein